MTENFEEKLGRLTELLEKQIESYAKLNDTTDKTERQQKKALEDSILQEKGYARVNGKIMSVEEARIKAEEKITQELYDNFGKEKVLSQKIQNEYDKQLKSITDVIKGSIEITDAQKQNLVKLKQSGEYIAAQQANEFKKQAESLGAIIASNGKLLEVNGKIIQNSTKLTGEQQKQLDQLKAGGAGKQVEQLAGQFRDTDAVLGSMNSQVKDLMGSSAVLTGGFLLAEAALSGTTKAITLMAKSIYDGQRGTKVTASAINEITTAIGDSVATIGTIIGVLGPWGRVAKLALTGLSFVAGKLIKLIGTAIEIDAEQNDKLFKSYNKLSASGLGAANGLEGVIDSLHRLNFTASAEEMEKFTELLASNSKELKLLGATAGEGAQNFAKVAGELSKSKIGEQLERLGVTADEQREHTLRYMAQQNRMGLMQGKTQSELIRGSQQYIEELDKIAMLTGASRKDQEEARAAIMAENELRAAMYEAEKNKDTELSAKLKQAFELAANLRVMGDTRGATGVSKYAAAGFNPTDEISGAAMQTYNQALTNISQGKGGSASENLTTALKGLQTSMDNYAGAAKYGGDFKALQSVDMAKGADMVLAGRRFEEEKLKNPNVTIDQVLEQIQNERKASDERLKATVAGNRMQQAAAQIMDKVAFSINTAAKINEIAATKFKEAVDMFSTAVGVKPVSGGTNRNSVTPPSTIPAIPMAPGAPPNAGSSALGGMADQRRSGLEGASQGIPTPLPSNLTPKSRGMKPVAANTPDDVMKLIKFQGDALGTRSHFDALDPYVKRNFMDMIAEYGKPVQINAAMRSHQEQQTLYDKWIANGKIGNPVAKPGSSKHNFGRALDLNSSQVTDLANSGLLTKYGFNTIPNDPPHIEMARFGGVFSGPESGYPVMLHGDQETVVTKPQFDEMANGVKKESVATAMSNLSTTTTNTMESPSAILQELLDLMEDKFDTMIDRLSTGNDISDKLLRNSMV
jgi:hypothetical protein